MTPGPGLLRKDQALWVSGIHPCPATGRYIQSLVQDGFVAQDKATGCYTLRPAAMDPGAAVSKRINPIEIASEEMRDLAGRIAASDGIAVRTRRVQTLMRWYLSDLISISSLNLGDILPLDNSVCGQVVAAFLPETAVTAVRGFQADFFPPKLPSAETLTEILRTHCAGLTGHLVAGFSGRAAPIMNAQNNLVTVMLTVTNPEQLNIPARAFALFDAEKRVEERTGVSFPDT